MTDSTFPKLTLSAPSLALICGAAIFVSACVGSWGHSGEGSPPLFGDFEAQRHWLEVTYNFPACMWYGHYPPVNDLLHWGLDYPPLTAYHSLLLSYFAPEKVVRPYRSRGVESYDPKVFMRACALVSDVLVFYSGAIFFVLTLNATIRRREAEKSRHSSTLLNVLGCLLMFPARIIIDHGHFQFNSVALGFILWSLAFYLRGKCFSSAAFFSFALVYKQTILYFAPAIFCAMLGDAVRLPPLKCVARVAGLGAVVVGVVGASFVPLLWEPDVPPGVSRVERFWGIVGRIFPFHRGLYEDHVANIWVLLSPILRFRSLMQHYQWARTLAMKCALTTTIASLILPAYYLLVCRRQTVYLRKVEALPRGKVEEEILLQGDNNCQTQGPEEEEREVEDDSSSDGNNMIPLPKEHSRLPVDVLCLGFFCSALAFFLCSWQVHEKAIILVTLPLLCTPSPQDRRVGQVLAGRVGLQVLWTLLDKDVLILPGVALTCLFWLLLSDCAAPRELFGLHALFPRKTCAFLDLANLGSLFFWCFVPLPKLITHVFPHLWSLAVNSSAALWLIALYVWGVCRLRTRVGEINCSSIGEVDRPKVE